MHANKEVLYFLEAFDIEIIGFVHLIHLEGSGLFFVLFIIKVDHEFPSCAILGQFYTFFAN